jgi:hypothetical protein
MKKFLSLILAALTCLCFAACAPADLDKAKEKMEKAEYSVVVTQEDATELLYGEKAVGMIVASTGGLLNAKVVTAVLFEDAESAKALAKDQDGKAEGKWAIWGDESAVDAFLK